MFSLEDFFFSLQEIFLFFPAQQSVLPHLRRRAAAAHTSRISRTNTRAYNGAVAARRKIINNKFIFYLSNENKRDHAKRAAANQFLRPNATNRRSRLTHGKVAKNLSDRTSSLLLFASERRKNGTSKSDGAGKRPSE